MPSPTVRPSISIPSATKTQSGDDLNDLVQSQVKQLQSQLNQQQNVQSVTDRLPNGRGRYGDTSMRVSKNGIDIIIRDSRGGLRRAQIGTDINNYLGLVESTSAVALSNFPNEGNWGWFRNTSTDKLGLYRTVNGAVRGIDLSTIIGTISAAQHGDLSGAGATPMHAFTQIAGTITATQHGNLSAAGGTAHAMGQISGSITEAQHGALSTGTDHAAVTSSVNGFMLATDKVILDAATATPTASVIVKFTAGSNLQASTGVNVGANKVIGARSTGWTAPTATQSKAGFANGATSAEIEQNLSAVINALITHGLLGA